MVVLGFIISLAKVILTWVNLAVLLKKLAALKIQGRVVLPHEKYEN
jgi:hypothetical protein